MLNKKRTKKVQTLVTRSLEVDKVSVMCMKYKVSDGKRGSLADK